MEIEKNKKDSTLIITLTGHLDTVTSKELDASLKDEMAGITDLVIDFAKVDYISSAGLRILLTYSKLLHGKEHVVVKNSNDVLKEIFKVTAFATFVTIE